MPLPFGTIHFAPRPTRLLRGALGGALCLLRVTICQNTGRRGPSLSSTDRISSMQCGTRLAIRSRTTILSSSLKRCATSSNGAWNKFDSIRESPQSRIAHVGMHFGVPSWYRWTVSACGRTRASCNTEKGRESPVEDRIRVSSVEQSPRYQQNRLDQNRPRNVRPLHRLSRLSSFTAAPVA